MIAQTVERFGTLDILVNNAGTAVAGPPETISLADWQRVVDVNLTGVFLCAREAAKAMIVAGQRWPHHQHRLDPGGGGFEPVPAAAYDATKGAVVNLTRDLAVHWAPHNILVNAIGPAYFPSEMTEAFLALPEMRREIERRTPLGRIGRPEELKERWSFSPRTRRPTSPVRHSMSTAAGRVVAADHVPGGSAMERRTHHSVYDLCSRSGTPRTRWLSCWESACTSSSMPPSRVSCVPRLSAMTSSASAGTMSWPGWRRATDWLGEARQLRVTS